MSIDIKSIWYCTKCQKENDIGTDICWNCKQPTNGAAERLKQEMVVVDVRIPFVSMVTLMVKWAIASIPALIILFFLATVFGTMAMAVFR